jgi:hypothetical protein
MRTFQAIGLASVLAMSAGAATASTMDSILEVHLQRPVDSLLST